MVIRGVLFDIGGVLEATPPTGWEQRWTGRLALDGIDMVRRLGGIWEVDETGTLSLSEVERATADMLQLDVADLRAFMDDLWTEYLGSLNEKMAQVLVGLRPRYRTGLLSNSFVGARQRERSAYDFDAMCDVIVYSHEEGMKKPGPRIYELACALLGVAPDGVLFIDDTEGHVEAARRLGMKGILFGDTEQAISEIRASGTI